MQVVDISLVVCTFNRAPLLRRTLESLARQTTGNRFTYEILVVDNASTDETPQVIRSAKLGNAVAVRGVREDRKGVAIARNRAISETRGAWIAYQDDDQWAEPDWLYELFMLAEKRKSLCVGGAVLLELPEDATRKLSPVCRGLLGEKSDQIEEFRFTRKVGPGAGNLMLARRVLEDVGGFDEQMSESGGEDADLWRRILAAGYESWFTPKAVIHHIIPAERLQDEYMRWTALRQGGHVALREFRNWGWWKMPGVVAARVAQTLMVYLPKYVFSKFGSDSEQALGNRCLLWRSEGYVRHALRFLLPSLFRQRAFLSAMEFRSGRQQLTEKHHG